MGCSKCGCTRVRCDVVSRSDQAIILDLQSAVDEAKDIFQQLPDTPSSVSEWLDTWIDDDPTPWCHVCGSMTSAGCDCGPTAENN